MFLWTEYGVKMNGFRQWLAAAVLYTLLFIVASKDYHRRSSASRSLPISKGGWRPVVGSSGYVFGGNYGVTPSHYNNYRIPVIDTYQSSLRPLSTRDATKLSSIAQSYHPTTLRTVSTAPPTPYHQPMPYNQPIQNSYHYQYPLPHPSLTKYKHVNYPSENIVIKNAFDPYAAKPLIPKYNSKYNVPLQSNLLQPIHIQPFHYSPQPGPLDVFGKPIQVYVRPNGSKPQSSGTEIYKPEVYKLPDSEPSPQSLSQQVKTAQQQNLVTPKASAKPFPQYLFQDISSNIIGPFNTFGVQSLQGRDPVYPTSKTTYLPPQQSKQTIFNSFSYTPNYKNNYADTTYNYNNIPTQQAPVTLDYNGNQGTFKASPQDPFIKQQHSINLGSIPATTYNPVFKSTTLANNYNGYGFPPQQQSQIQTFYNQLGHVGHEKKKQKIHDSLAAAGINEQAFQYVGPPKKVESEKHPKVVPFKAAYEVTETYYEDDSNSGSKTTKPPLENYSSQKTNELVTTEEYRESIGKLTTIPITVLPEEYAFIPESDDVNSLNYDGQLETQSRRPLGDDFEPIRKQKLKDYYYKVSPPTQGDHQQNRVKKPIEATKATAQQDLTTSPNINKDITTDITPLEALPTLPPNKHFKRPSTPEPNGRDKTRKRNKLRRRRPLADKHHAKEETNTSNHFSSSTESTSNLNLDESEKRHQSRVRTNKGTADLTTLSTTIELTTSALPTVAPTNPTVVRKKLIHRRPVTTPASKLETTVQSINYSEYKGSPVMKISEGFNLNILPVENKAVERPDYSHKQDEKDTPTSDIAVLTNKQKNDASNVQDFSFHRDSKPIEAKLEPVRHNFRETTTEENTNEISITTSHGENLSDNKTKLEVRPKSKNKHENNRPRFSIKDYRNRLSSTTTTTEKSADTYISRMRFPQRKSPYENTNTENETTTERKKFTPKEPRYKHVNVSDNNEGTEKSHKYTRQPGRQRQSAADTGDVTTHKISSRIRNGSRKPKPTEETTETSSPTSTTKKIQRKKVTDSVLEESVQDISVTEIPLKDIKPKEKPNSESAIMKIADKKHHQDPIEHIFEHTKRVSDLTLAASKDYNKLGLFKNVSNNSRRIPNYFTIATDDPILPIEAFFPQLNQRKDS